MPQIPETQIQNLYSKATGIYKRNISTTFDCIWEI